jgi:hypothetical protein
VVLTAGGVRKRIAGPGGTAVADLDKSVEIGIATHADLLMDQNRALVTDHADVAAYFKIIARDDMDVLQVRIARWVEGFTDGIAGPLQPSPGDGWSIAKAY